MLFKPGTNDLYGCDHGSDMFGKSLGDVRNYQPITDWNPPDEFNKLEQGKFYGHPYITGDRIPRVEYQKRPDIHDLAAKTTVPIWKFPAHVAACGWTFIQAGARMPKDHIGDAFIAQHGSYNRDHKVGYAIERLMFDDATGLPYASWKIVGCLARDGNTVLARPADITQGPDGDFYFTDEIGKQIFRLSYVGAK
jgi:glucose/arabinose dehydrogenase